MEQEISVTTEGVQPLTLPRPARLLNSVLESKEDLLSF